MTNLKSRIETIRARVSCHFCGELFEHSYEGEATQSCDCDHTECETSLHSEITYDGADLAILEALKEELSLLAKEWARLQEKLGKMESEIPTPKDERVYEKVFAMTEGKIDFIETHTGYSPDELTSLCSAQSGIKDSKLKEMVE